LLPKATVPKAPAVPGADLLAGAATPPAAAAQSARAEAAGPESAGADAGAPSFEAALAELEGIVARMEAGELTLEQSLAAYKRGADLLQLCQGALRDAQQQVKVLEEGLLKDFSGGAQPD
jgi:exodeoxyribonuclease VII small subunit